jgi:O-antigen/teichoic acid export membrane protein
VLGAASVVATGLNYVFLLAAGRLLGSNDYGALAALLGLLTVVLLPAGAVQLAVSREVSRRLALDDAQGAAAFGRAALRLGLFATAPLVALALALVAPVDELLNIGSSAAVALAAVAVSVAFVLPLSMGLLQGYQRFQAVATLYVLPFAVRLVLLAVLVAWAGYELEGGVFAALAGALATAAVALWLVHEPLKRGAHAIRPALAPFLRYLWPVVIGLLGIAVLTNEDLLVVKARFSPDDAGDYAAASAFARVAFFLPATILTVLFPRTAARQARGEDTDDILGRSLIVTVAFCVVLTVGYALVGEQLVRLSFGSEFSEAGALLPAFTVEMSLFSLANVLVGFHLSRGETRYAWIVAGAVVVQFTALALLPTSPTEVIWTNITVGIVLLGAHELLVGSSVPALRAGLRRFR